MKIRFDAFNSKTRQLFFKTLESGKGIEIFLRHASIFAAVAKSSPEGDTWTIALVTQSGNMPQWDATASARGEKRVGKIQPQGFEVSRKYCSGMIRGFHVLIGSASADLFLPRWLAANHRR